MRRDLIGGSGASFFTGSFTRWLLCPLGLRFFGLVAAPYSFAQRRRHLESMLPFHSLSSLPTGLRLRQWRLPLCLLAPLLLITSIRVFHPVRSLLLFGSSLCEDLPLSVTSSPCDAVPLADSPNFARLFRILRRMPMAAFPSGGTREALALVVACATPAHTRG